MTLSQIFKMKNVLAAIAVASLLAGCKEEQAQHQDPEILNGDAQIVDASFVPQEIYNFDPNADLMKGSDVSEFEWALDELDDICDSGVDDYMTPICDVMSDIRVDLKNDDYMSFYGQDIGARLTPLQINDALHMSARLHHAFQQVANTITPCKFDQNMECATIHFESTGEYKTFAFPLQPA